MNMAKDKYIQRKNAQKTPVPKSLLKSSNEFANMNLKTVNPDVPDYTKKLKMHKIGGGCITKDYERFFTVDEANFTYFVNKDDK